MPPVNMEFKRVGNMGWNEKIMLEISTEIEEVCWKNEPR